ncbi:MAG: MotA/TolQ/ExbB proton channel family protein [candidate division Zixibacteria bacterium]|nr:MotA/TolQ/ExbB proton channel family protein [candidate division Zixibacteria bacterium]
MYVKILLIQGNFWELLSHASLFMWVIVFILAAMSLGSWGVIFNKWRIFRAVDKESRLFLTTFRRRRQLAEVKAKLLVYQRTPLARIFEQGYQEYQNLLRLHSPEGFDSDLAVRLTRDELAAIDRVLERETSVQVGFLERSVPFLATTGNVAPFFGLLGTCWGIMCAFLNIGAQGSASLIVVAPGIAEALVATIFGLAVAIPAVIGYNWCNTRLKNIADDLDNFSLEFLTVVSQEQDQ